MSICEAFAQNAKVQVGDEGGWSCYAAQSGEEGRERDVAGAAGEVSTWKRVIGSASGGETRASVDCGKGERERESEEVGRRLALG